MPFAAIYHLEKGLLSYKHRCEVKELLSASVTVARESMLLCPSAGCANPPESMLFHYAGTQAHLSGTANS